MLLRRAAAVGRPAAAAFLVGVSLDSSRPTACLRIDNEIKLDFKDVLIRPKRSTLRSRKEVSMERSIQFKHSGRTLKCVPVAVWKSTSELGYPENYCGDLRGHPRHRADAVAETTSRRSRGAPEL